MIDFTGNQGTRAKEQLDVTHIVLAKVSGVDLQLMVEMTEGNKSLLILIPGIWFTLTF